jgi:hypothetical protein
MQNNKLIVSYLEIMCIVKTFIDMKKAQDARFKWQVVPCT